MSEKKRKIIVEIDDIKYVEDALAAGEYVWEEYPDACTKATNIKLEALITERTGMVAENEQRAHLGNSLAYGMDDFVRLADRMRALKSEPEKGER